MNCRCCSWNPVSPALCSPVNSAGAPGRLDQIGGELCGVCEEDDEDIVGVNPGDLALGEPIVGQQPRQESKIKPLPNPKNLTEAEWREHLVTHLPYCDGCPFCVAGKRPNSHHRMSDRIHTIPNISLDYGFLRDATSDDVTNFLGAYVRPYKLYLQWSWT